MSTRITNVKREAIIKDETTKKFYDKKLQAHKKIIDYLDKEASKQVDKKVVESGLVEQGYINTCSTVRLTGDNRDKVESLIRVINGVRRSYRSGSVSIHNSYPCKKFQDFFDVKLTSVLERKIETYNKLIQKEKEFRNKLTVVLNSYTTSKQLLKALPELSIHFKDEQRINAVVPFEQINEVKKLLAR